MGKYLGIDVSENNEVLDWNLIKNSGIDYAVIRVGYGLDLKNQDDSQAVRNMEECERLGIPYGVYLYSYALCIDEAANEASHALRMVQNFNPALGVWFDMEDADGYKEKHGINVYESRELLTDICRTFCSIIAEAGYTAGIYANKDYWTNVLLAEQLKDYPVWLAHWNTETDEPSMPCLMWQYTSDGSVPGSSERTDMNYYYGELPVNQTPQEDNEQSHNLSDSEYEECTKYAYSVGDTVEYNKIYASSTSDEGLKPIYTSGTITRIVFNARNPYLIDNGIGWTNDDCITAGSDDSDDSEDDSDCGGISVGDTVRFNGDTDYNGTSIKAWHNDSGYEVTQLDGDRAVLSYNGTVFAAVNAADLELV